MDIKARVIWIKLNHKRGMYLPIQRLINLKRVMKKSALQGLENFLKQVRLKRLMIYLEDHLLHMVNGLPSKSLTVLKIGRATSELQSRFDLVCRLLLEKKKQVNKIIN